MAVSEFFFEGLMEMFLRDLLINRPLKKFVLSWHVIVENEN